MSVTASDYQRLEKLLDALRFKQQTIEVPVEWLDWLNAVRRNVLVANSPTGVLHQHCECRACRNALRYAKGDEA